MLRTAFIASIAAAAIAASASAAQAGLWINGDNITTIWVTIKAHRGEGSWEACRRLYQRDVYGVYRRSETTVRCRIDHSRIYDYQPRRQNFN